MPEQQLPGFESIKEPQQPKPVFREPTPDEVSRRNSVILGSLADREIDPEDSNTFPLTDGGYIDIDNIKPGQYDPSWGPVLGKYSGNVINDISIAPISSIPVDHRKIASARHYATLINERMKAIKKDNLPRVDKLDSKIKNWLNWSLNNEFRKDI